MYEFDTHADFIAGDERYLMHSYARLPVKFVRGSGCVLTDSEGRDYLDFLGGIGVVCLGHCHPRLVDALRGQAERLWQVGNYFHVENRSELAAALSRLLGATTDEEGHVTGSTGQTWRTFFANSGAEANEGAIKLARRWGERRLGGATGIVTAKRSFHGRTLATLAATGQDVFHKSFAPMPAGFMSAELNDLAALEEAIARPEAGCGPVCAIMLECVQGEGGVWPADPEYLQGAARLCEERGLVLIVDEVQTGVFRCGAPFSYQLAGIVPDIVSMAKGIAGGFPMGAFSAHGKVADLLGPGDHGSTFGGNPLACAVGRATMETLVAEGIGEHVIEVGAQLAERLAALPHVTEVRGRGLMRGAQLDAPMARSLVEQGLHAGLVLNCVGDSTLRFLPPLVVTTGQVDAMAERLAKLMGQVA